jgi:hypothetical protein
MKIAVTHQRSAETLFRQTSCIVGETKSMAEFMRDAAQVFAVEGRHGFLHPGVIVLRIDERLGQLAKAKFSKDNG